MRLLSILYLFLLVFTCSCNSSSNSDKVTIENTQQTLLKKLKYSNPQQWWILKMNEVQPTNDLIKEFPEKYLDSLHRIMCIDRWNHNGDIEMKHGSRYNQVAEAVNTPKSILEAADKYIEHEKLNLASTLMKEFFEKDTVVKADFYHPVNQTAFIGTYTFHCELKLNCCRDDTNINELISTQLERLKSILPEFIQGIKIYSVNYYCKRLETEGSLNKGILWRKVDDLTLHFEECIGRGRGKTLPQRASYWCQDEWNNGKELHITK
jgi:hypothetical protein